VALVAGFEPASAGTLTPLRPSDLITLQASSDQPTGSGCAFGAPFAKLLQADGTQNTFAGIPAGQVLIITEVDFYAYGVLSNQIILGSIEIENGAGYSEVLRAVAYSNNAGQAAANLAIPDGLPVKPGPGICFAINSSSSAMKATLHGYFTVDR